MPGIYLAALLTTAVAGAVFGIFIRKLPQPADARWLWLAFALVLPLQPLAFHCLRLPLDRWLVAQFGSSSSVYQWLITFYAPLTEEPAKLLPLLIPAIFRDIRRENFVRYAFAIGLGFAIGEMWFIAERINRQPSLASLPFYQFGGYAMERLMTCVFHSAFVALALWQLRHNFLLGFTGAVFAHWIANFPLSLMAWNVGGLGKTVWMVIVQGWLFALFVGASALLCHFCLGRSSLATMIFGRRRCPECSGEYEASFFAINFGPTRYERCPHCRRWHWTGTSEA